MKKEQKILYAKIEEMISVFADLFNCSYKASLTLDYTRENFISAVEKEIEYTKEYLDYFSEHGVTKLELLDILNYMYKNTGKDKYIYNVISAIKVYGDL